MKDLGEIGQLTKFDAFRINRDIVMDLETCFEIHTANVSYSIFSADKCLQDFFLHEECKENWSHS